MEIWILIIVLLAIAIILLIASFFTQDTNDIDRELSEFTVQQSEEMYQLKQRIAHLEQHQGIIPPSFTLDTEPDELIVGQEEAVLVTDDYGNEELIEHITIDDIDDNTYEEIIRLYSQGYTMSEISQQIDLSTQLVQSVIDNYIENK